MELFILLILLFILPPCMLTFFNVKNLFAKKAVFTRCLIVCTSIFGILYYIFLFIILGDAVAQWHEQIYDSEVHQIISSEYALSFILPCSIGFLGLFIIAFFPAKKLPPLIAASALAAILIGMVESIVFIIQISARLSDVTIILPFFSL